MKTVTDPAATLTLNILMRRVSARYWEGTANQVTAEINAKDCLRVLGADRAVDEIDESAIDELVDALRAKGNSNATINRKLAALSKMLSFAHQRGQIARVPRIERLKENQHRTRFFSPEEEAEMMRWCDKNAEPWFKHLITFLMYTGLRRSEALRTAWKDFGVGLKSVTVWKSKNAEARTVPLSAKAKAAAEAMLGTKHGPWLAVEVADIDKFWHKMRDVLADSNDDQFVLHALRHTFCSRLVQRGVDLYRVKELAGHKSYSTTLRYAHLKRDQLIEAVSVLD